MKEIILMSSVFLLCSAGCNDWEHKNQEYNANGREGYRREDFEQKKREIIITKDSSYTICGVTDPINNIPWLADTVAVAIDMARNDDNFYSAHVILYKHKTEEKHLIGVQFTYYSQLDCCCECGPFSTIYTCSKEAIVVKGNNAAPYPEFDDNYEWGTTLWNIEVVYSINEKKRLS